VELPISGRSGACEASSSGLQPKRVIVTVTVTLPLPLSLEPPAPGPTVLLAVPPRTIRIRRRRRASDRGRAWVVDVEVDLPEQDPEQLLAGCEGYLVDTTEGQALGVVDEVELRGPEGSASALIVVHDWLGRHRLRVDCDAVEVLLPTEQRVIVDASGVAPLSTGRSR
jgi:hypothetical protein